MKATKKSAVPIYLIGVVWILYGLVFPLYRLSDIVIVSALSAIVYMLSGRVIKPKEVEVKSGVPALDAMSEKGQDYLKRLRALNDEIEDADISAGIASIEQTSSDIFDYIVKNPSKLNRIQSFMDYYLPTTLKLLDTYGEFSKRSSTGENMTTSMESIRKTINQVDQAFKKQADALYEDTAMDVSVEISVLQQMMVQDGLVEKK